MEPNQSPPSPKSFRRRGIYLLPNLFTTGALFFGFYAIVASMNDQFSAAAIAIFVAMMLDGLDGRVARFTNTQSEFGEQYDSLSDIVAFGVAPAIVVFNWDLDTFGKIGWVATFMYVAGTALRLARFNVQIDVVSKHYFIGLPCPSAAAVVAGFIWVVDRFALMNHFVGVFSAILIALLGLLMVSNFPYYSFKVLDVKGKVPFFVILLIVLVFTIIAIQPAIVLLSIFMLYALSGPVLWLWRLYKKSARKSANAT